MWNNQNDNKRPPPCVSNRGTLIERKRRSSSEPTQPKQQDQDSNTDFKLHTAPIAGKHQASPYLRRMRLPSLNGASSSYDDLMSPVCDQVQADHWLYQNVLAWTQNNARSVMTSGPDAETGSLNKNTELMNTDLSALSIGKMADTSNQSNITNHTTKSTTSCRSSDYFSMTDSMYSECDHTEFPRAPSPTRFQKPAADNFADVLKQISAETADIDRRNREINEAYPD